MHHSRPIDNGRDAIARVYSRSGSMQKNLLCSGENFHLGLLELAMSSDNTYAVYRNIRFEN